MWEPEGVEGRLCIVWKKLKRTLGGGESDVDRLIEDCNGRGHNEGKGLLMDWGRLEGTRVGKGG